jgi:hypothetical protein
MLFGAVTLQAWCFQALQQIACEKCGLIIFLITTKAQVIEK